MPRVKGFDKEVKKENENPHAGHRARQRRRVDVDREMDTFADHELLEFRLGLVIPRRDTNELAHRLIKAFGSLDSVLSATPKELYEVSGMTMSAAYMLATDFSFVRRALRSCTNEKKIHVKTPEKCIKTMYTYFVGRKTECVCIAFLDSSYGILKLHFLVSESGHEVYLDVADITKRAIREGAVGVVLAHNHPMGTLTPSRNDLEATEQLLYMLSAAKIRLIDHLIFKNNAVFSFNNNAILSKFRLELKKRNQSIISSDVDVPQIFLGSLEEYVLDPKELEKSKLKSISKKELVDRLYDKSAVDDNCLLEEVEPLSKLLDGVVVSSVVLPSAYKSINDQIAATTKYEEVGADGETITYEIDPDDIF